MKKVKNLTGANTLAYFHPDIRCKMSNQGSLTEREGLVQLTSFTSEFRSAPFYIENIIYNFYKTSYINEEVNCTETSHSVSFPWSN
jgi:hypothetical protein